MGILDSIKAIFGPSKEEAADPGSLTNAYVDWLPNYLLGSGASQATIDSSRPLPGAGKFSGTAPEATAVINRLKILSGLSPMHYSEPKSGQFTRQAKNYLCTFKTTFTDKDGRSRCAIALSVRAQ
jgi:hypothetical protein